MRTQRLWWAWPMAGSLVMALYVAGMLAANHHGRPHGQGAGAGYAFGDIFFGAIGFVILGAEWSIAMLPAVPRRWVGDVLRTMFLMMLLVLPASALWGLGG